MELSERIKSFSALGEILRNSLNGEYVMIGRDQSVKISTLIDKQHLNNPWFTPENVRTAINAIAAELTEENLVRWTSSYPQLKEEVKPVRVGVIMAGNIPLVGFHDFISVLISGNNLIAKTSSKDSELIVYIAEILCRINPAFRNKIEFASNTLTGFDVIIAIL
jgi:hypothetical protein